MRNALLHFCVLAVDPSSAMPWSLPCGPILDVGKYLNADLCHSAGRFDSGSRLSWAGPAIRLIQEGLGELFDLLVKGRNRLDRQALDRRASLTAGVSASARGFCIVAQGAEKSMDQNRHAVEHHRIGARKDGRSA